MQKFFRLVFRRWRAVPAAFLYLTSALGNWDLLKEYLPGLAGWLQMSLTEGIVRGVLMLGSLFFVYWDVRKYAAEEIGTTKVIVKTLLHLRRVKTYRSRLGNIQAVYVPKARAVIEACEAIRSVVSDVRMGHPSIWSKPLQE